MKPETKGHLEIIRAAMTEYVNDHPNNKQGVWASLYSIEVSLESLSTALEQETEKYRSSISVVKKLQAEREGLVRRVEDALRGIEKGEKK